MNKIGLALQGGGSHGAFAWGVLDRILELEENELGFDSICGTSAGAINAVVMTYGMHIGGRMKAKELLERMWLTMANKGGFKLDYPFIEYFTQIVSPYQFNPLNYNPLRKIVSDLVDFDELRKTKIKLFICATNVKTNQGKIFRTSGITLDSVMASTALPTFFQAVKIDGEHYWDGGYMGNPPLAPLIANSKITDLLLIKLNSINIDRVPKSSKDISDRVTEICFNSSLMNEMRMIEMRNELIRSGLDLGKYGNKEIFVHSISGYDTLGKLDYSTKMNTDLNFLLRLKNAGREAADKWIKEELKNVGKKSSFDVDKHFFNKF
jgi:NTE family protein